MPQIRQRLNAKFDEMCPRIVETITRRTVPPRVDRHARRTVALLVAAVTDEYVKGRLSDFFSAPDQFALGVGPFSFTESVLERSLRGLALSRAALGNPRARSVERSIQVSPTGAEHILLCQVAVASHEEGKPFYLPSASRSTRSPQGGAKVENCQDEYVRKDKADRNHHGQKVCDKREMIPMRLDISSNKDDIAGDDKRHKKNIKKKKN